MLKQTALLAGVALALSATAQADYQWEVGAAWATGDVTTSNNVDADQDVYSFTGSWFIAPVDVSKGPLGEAAFLDRASSISLDYVDGEIDADAGNLDIENYGVRGRYVWADSGWFVEGGYNSEEQGNFDADIYGIGVGMYVAPNTTVTVGYNDIDGDIGADADGWGIDLKHVQLWGDQALKVELGYSNLDPDNGKNLDTWSIGSTWYICKTLGVGGSYSTQDAGTDDLESWQLFAEWFVHEQVALGLAYTEAEADSGPANSDAVVLRLLGRF